MIVDDDAGPWTAAAYLVEDVHFQGTQHGTEGDATLCGIPKGEFTVVRNPFWGTGPSDCTQCATRLRELAEPQ